MNKDDEIVGHKTFADGSHEPLSRKEAAAFIALADENKKNRAMTMPTTQGALRVIVDASIRLRELGWREAMYCPKDGSSFAAIALGSSGIFRSFYMGEWPKGHLYIDDFMCGVDGHFFKAIKDLTEDETAVLTRCDEETKMHIERDAKAFGADV